MFYCGEGCTLHDKSSIWSDINREWRGDGIGMQWRAVGTTPRKFMPDLYSGCTFQNIGCQRLISNCLPKQYYCVVKLQSGRLEMGYCLGGIDIGMYVILEADRGEDCGKVIENIEENELEGLRSRIRNPRNDPWLKRILRIASSRDFDRLKQRKKIELHSLEQCKELVSAKGLCMEILYCEYRWDMKKVIFYFRSKKRVDFRDLLKDLFKIFKIRIWMCAGKVAENNIIKRT